VTAVATPALDELRPSLARLRGDTATAPDASIVIPVNAQADLDTVRTTVLADVVRYEGPHAFEVVLVINNFPPDELPAAIEAYRDAGLTVAAVPSVWRRGEAVCLTARVPGIREAASERIVLFDADCRVPNPTRLLDWYVEQFDSGADVVYSRVDYFDLRKLWSVRARILVHRIARWFKRAALRFPTTRGSNYGVRRDVFLRLYDEGRISDDLNVGPAAKAGGHRIAYSGDRSLAVLTSGRKFKGGWKKLAFYLVYRLRYNARLLLARGGKPREEADSFNSKPLR
jgi:hypothetical protein